MNLLKPFILFSFLVITFACEKPDPDKPVTTPEESAGGQSVINGTDFKAAETQIIETPSGLEFSLKDGIEEIRLRLDDYVAGTYTIQSTTPGGRTQALEATTEYIDANGKVFYGESGTITVTENTDNTLSATFSLTGKSAAGDKAAVTSGAVNRIPVSKRKEVGCLPVKWSDNEQSDRLVFKYDGAGRVISSRFDDSGQITYVDQYLFTYVNNKVTAVRAIFHHGDEIEQYDLAVTYDGDLINTIEDAERGMKYIFVYSGGRLSSVARSQNGSNSIYAFEYDDAGNVTTSLHPSYEESFHAYDDKGSPGSLLIKALNNQPALVYLVDGSAESFSVNNPGEIISSYDFGETDSEKFTYRYNVRGYPTDVTSQRNGQPGSAYSVTYWNCL